MDRSLESGEFYAACEPPTIDYGTALTNAYAQFPVLPALPMNDAANEMADGCEPFEAVQIEHWKPIEPQYCKAIADHYQVGKRSIQKWFADLLKLAPWLTVNELRLDDDRYTPLAVELLGDRYFAGSTKKWAQRLQQRYANVLASEPWQAEAPAIRPEVLPRPDVPSEAGDRAGGLNLHIGSALNPLGIAGIVVPSNDAAYLSQIQQKLEQFATLQQNAIAQMHSEFKQAQALNAQFQQATSLSDQLMLQEYQLRGVQLGYAAVQLKHEAFKATVQSAEAGTLPVPGKPQAESAASPSA